MAKKSLNVNDRKTINWEIFLKKRQEHRLTQQEVFELTGVSKSVQSGIENGRKSRGDHLIRLLFLYGITSDEIFY